MNSEKTILPSLRNIEWKALKIETNKINHILPYIQTNNITELNELIYAGAKLVCENIGSPQKTRRNSKTRDGKLDWNCKKKKKRKQARMMKRGTEISGGGRRNRPHGEK